MESPRNLQKITMDGGKTDYGLLPLVISEDYDNLPPAKLRVWDKKTRSWVLVLEENWYPPVVIRYIIRNSGIHIMAIQQLDDKPFDGETINNSKQELPNNCMERQLVRLSSLVFTKHPESGPILYHTKKIPCETRQPGNGQLLQIDFRVFSGGFVFAVDPASRGISLTSALLKDTELALGGMLDTRNKLRRFQDDGEPIWLRLDTSKPLKQHDEFLTALEQNKTIWLGINERLLPWMEIPNTQNPCPLKNVGKNIEFQHQLSVKTEDEADSHVTSIAELQSLPRSPKLNAEAILVEGFPFPYLETSLKKVDTFIWEPAVLNWTCILPEKFEKIFKLSLNLQLLSDGIELGLFHQVPKQQSSISHSESSFQQILGSIKWYLGGNITNIQYYIRMRDGSEKGSRLPVVYFNLPELIRIQIAEKGGQVFDGMIHVAKEVLGEFKLRTEFVSPSSRWLCLKLTNTQNQALFMEDLQRENSPYTRCRSAAIPRRHQK